MDTPTDVSRLASLRRWSALRAAWQGNSCVPEYVKNHVVPAALLRGFTNSKERLCVYRVQEKRWLENQLPENVALHSKFYWVEGAKDPAVLEKGLASEVDGPAAAVFERLREAPRLPSSHELENLIVFVAFQMVRVPLFRDWHRQKLKDSTPEMLEEDVTRQDFRGRRQAVWRPRRLVRGVSRA